MPLDEQLVTAVLADRDALEPWRILGDALESAGDPHGRLVGLMLAHEAKPALKLITARKEWLKTHAAALVPPDLDEKTLVWRRGFLSEATLPGPRLIELIDHPSLQFLDHATLGVNAPLDQLEGRVLPWRSAVIVGLDDGHVDPRPLLRACPKLERLAFRVPREQDQVEWLDAPGLRELELEWANPSMMLGAARAFAGLKMLRFNNPRLSPIRSDWQQSGLLERLDQLVIAAACSEELASALEKERPARLGVLGTGYDDPVEEGVLERTAYSHHEENAWLIALPFEAEAALRDLAFGNQVTELAVRSGRVRFGAVELSVLELRSPPGSVALGDYAQALAERSGTGRCLGFAVSSSRHQVASWLVKNGPARTAANHYRAEEVFRRNVELLFGVDPGPRGIELLRRALHGVPPRWLLGKPSRSWPPLITDGETVELTDEELDEEELGEEDDQYWEIMDQAQEDVAAEAEANAAAPLLMESESEPVVKVVPSILDVVPEPLADAGLEEESDADVDEEPFRDALDATVHEIWTQTPVEPDDDDEEPVTRAFNEPEPDEGVAALGAGEVSLPCRHCGTAASTEPCVRCGDNVCSTCADGDEDQRLCHECEPSPA